VEEIRNNGGHNNGNYYYFYYFIIFIFGFVKVMVNFIPPLPFYL